MTVAALRLVVASANPDKAAEIVAILESVPGLELVPRPASARDVEESGDTLIDNARLKARALVEVTGVAAVADDTGLEVDALGGAPGVYSARFAGEHASYADNVAKLLDELEKVGAIAAEQRSASFRCVALVAYPDGSEVSVDGKVTGTITRAPLGESGFGYDPVFAPDGYGGRTFAEMSPAEKHEASHRGKAFGALAARLTAGSDSSRHR